MNNSKGIFKSNKSITPDSQIKKVHLHLETKTDQTLLQHENASVENNQQSTIQKTQDKRANNLQSSFSRDGRDSCKTIKSRSCLKKEHSRCEEQQEAKSVKSIKFKPTVTNVFQYSLPQRSIKLASKKLTQHNQKVEGQCCDIY